MENKGLYVKYEVRKKENGELVDGCFVLRPDKDPAAVYALVEYAKNTENQELKRDIATWLKAVTGKEGVHYYEVGEGEYVIARNEEEAFNYYSRKIDALDAIAAAEVTRLDDFHSFSDGLALKHILTAEKIPNYTHSDYADNVGREEG